MNFDRVSSSIHSNPRKGIGEYEGNINTRKTKRRALCIAKIALNILLGSALLSTIALSAVLCPLSLILSIPISIAAAAFSIKQIMKICNEIKGIKHTAPSTHTLIPEEIEKKGPKLGEWGDTRLQCAPFRDCMQSFEFKKKLIENAEQEILISGSYCGRRAFDEILDAMEKRMQEKPDLRVHILTATRFVTDQDKFKSKNWKRIQELTEKYPNRFFTVFSFETFQANPNRPGFKYISNHAKLLIVDRRAMITGGGGIEDRWAYSNGL